MVEGTAQRLDELQRRCSEATPGPWVFAPTTHGDPFVAVEGYPVTRRVAEVWKEPNDYGRADARFIAVAREAVPWLIGLVRGQADALQAATERIDATVELLREAAQDINILPFLRALGAVAALGVGVPETSDAVVRDEAEAALQRVRELRDELATPPRDPVHRGILLPTVGRQFVLHRLDAALGVGGVPTEHCGCETDRHERTERECPNFHFQRHSPHVWNNGHHVCYGWPRNTTMPPIIPAELLRPDPDLMGSPEGDLKGLRELQDAARAQVPENPPTEYPCPHARPSWRQCPWCLGVNGPVTSVDPPKETQQ